MDGLGVLVRDAFRPDKDYYAAITSEHTFQTLMLDVKPSEAFRRGVYITRVDETPDGAEARFRLLRCSTNLAGPTENVRATDAEILGVLNGLRERYFPGTAKLNHVLAQTYHNTVGPDGKQRKAKISSHSDKTKDMPSNAVMAFCTFYDRLPPGSTNVKHTDEGDVVVGNVSALTRLRFRRKADGADTQVGVNTDAQGTQVGVNTDAQDMQVQVKTDAQGAQVGVKTDAQGTQVQVKTDAQGTQGFDVVLSPNSVFMMPLSTNRLYTHEIVPPVLPVDQIPTRLGYVVRSSSTEAVHRDGHTYLVRPGGQHTLLEPPDDEGVRLLRELYFSENTTASVIEYDTEHRFPFSLNSGDYLRPTA